MTAHEPPKWVAISDLELAPDWNAQVTHEWDEILERLDHIEYVLLSNAELIRELVDTLRQRV